jgi:Tol biopolymer transport system component
MSKRKPFFFNMILLSSLLVIASILLQNVEIKSGSSDAILTSDRGLIVFVGMDGNITTSTSDGITQVAITTDAIKAEERDGFLRHYLSPTWAPRTNQLAFLRVDLTPAGKRQISLEISSANGEGKEVVFNSDRITPFYLYWSPDGEKLSFLSSGEQGEPLSLWVKGFEGKAQRIDQGQPYYWAWAPQSDELLAHVGGSTERNPDTSRLSWWLGSEKAGDEIELTLLEFQAPAFSPDGAYVLVLAKPEDKKGGLALLDSDGQLVSVLSDVEGPTAFDWSASGRYIAFITGSDPSSSNLRLLDVENPFDPRPLDLELENPVAFYWSPVGDRLLVLTPALITPGSKQNVSTGHQERKLYLTLSVVDINPLAIRNLITFQPTSALLEILPFFDQYQRSTTIWSPDGTQMVYAALRDDDTAGIFVIDTMGLESPRLIGEGIIAFWSTN